MTATARITLQLAGDEHQPAWDAEQCLCIGRMPSCDVVLDDGSISRRHAEVVYAEGAWVVRDLGSTNGTMLNGVRLGRIAQRLRQGDQLQPGKVLLIVRALYDESHSESGTLSDCAVQSALAVDAAATPPPVETQFTRPRTVLPRDERGEPAGADAVREFLATSLRGAVEALQAHTGAVFLREPGARRLVLKANCGVHAAVRSHDAALVQRCLQQGVSFVCADVEGAADAGPRSVLCVPLRQAHGPDGVLFVERPAGQPAFGEREHRLADAIAHTMSAGVASAQQLLERQRALFMQTVLTLAQAVDCRDPYTAGHTQRVTDYVLLLAEEVQVSAADYHYLQIGTPLHDIGKIGIDDAILRKPGRLTAAEFAAIQAHPSKGVALLESIPELDPVLPIVGSHHEHWDGSGYPDGARGETISPLARLVTVADVFDALTSDRPYRKALSPAEAFAYVQRNAGTLFDPQYAQAFQRVRPQIEKLLRERGSVTATVSKRELDRLKESLALAGIARVRRPHA